MKVNISNYEVWMIDYFDGKLNTAEVAELMAFVDEHQEIKEEFEAFENIGIDSVDVGYTAKDALKKDPIVPTANINEENYEDYFVAFYENDLSATEQTEILTFVDSNPAIKNEFAFHGELRLSDSPVVVFNNKAGLKRKAAIGIYWQIAGVAAAILILFGLFNLFDFGNSSSLNRPENKLVLSELRPKTVGIDLKQHTSADIIEKRIQFVETAFLNEETSRNELIAFHELESQTPDISIAESIDYPELAEHESAYFDMTFALAETNQPKRKSAFGRVIQNLSRRVTGNIPVDENDKSLDDPTFVKALGRTITVFNTITGSDTELVKAYDQNGNLTKYYVEGETIAWSRDIASNNE